MESAIRLTEWPKTAIPRAVQELLERFFALVDSNDASSGSILAEKIFSSDGMAEFGGRWYKGTTEISTSRDNAWKVVKRRKHTLQKVYVESSEADDLLFIGHIAMDFENGNAVEQQFAGRFKISDSQTSSPKIRSFQVWADSGPTLKALQSS